jgi:putative tryptophan/tyrosine transport system substrate-binding protein
MIAKLKRRDFIALLGGAAAPWPFAARAQQSAMPVIGLLSSASAESYVDVLKAFQQGLQESGYVDGHNLAIHEQARMAPTCRYDWSFRR